MKKIFDCFCALALMWITSGQAAAGTVHVLMHNESTLFAQELKANLVKIAENEGHKLDIYDAKGDAATQLDQFKQVCKDGATIMVSLQDPTQAQKFLDLALSKGNRVIFFNRKPKDTSILQEYDQTWYVGSDNMQGGNLQAAMIDSYLKAHPETDRDRDGIFNLVILQGPDLNEDSKFRTINVQLTLNLKGSHVKLLRKDFCDWDRTKAQHTMERYIGDFGINTIELVIANNDAMALGAVDALNAVDFNKGDAKLIPVFGIDGTPEALQAIKENKMQGTIKQNANLVAHAAMLMATLPDPDDAQLSEELEMRIIENDGVIELPFILMEEAE